MKKIAKSLGVLLLTLLLVIFLDIGCMVKYVTGFPCPGCGTTRAVIAFAQGHLVEAFYWHPLFWLTVPLLLVGMFMGGRFFKKEKSGKFFWLTLTLMYLSVYAVRMVLLFPDTPPMDYKEQSLLFQLYTWVRNMWP